MNDGGTLELMVKKVFSQVVIDDQLVMVLPNFELQEFRNHNLQQIIRGIYRCLCQEVLMETYPSDWWQAFKERWFPPWLLSRYPVRYTDIIAEHRFPEMAIPKLGREKIYLRKQI